jgi:hypothetical protein
MNSDLANLRRARSRCHFRLKQAEQSAEGYRTKLADIEARIQAIAPALQLPVQFRKPKPVFARGELRRLALDQLREAGEPLSVRDMAWHALAAKGVGFPDWRTMKATRVRLREVFGRLVARGLARTVGVGKTTRRELVAPPSRTPPPMQP